MTGGPLVSLGLLENEFNWADLSDSVFTYVKTKGQSTDVKLDGTVLSERADENERFYGNNYSVPKILAGDINQSLPQLRPLTEVLKAAEGRTDFDAGLVEQLASQPTPGDASIESPTSASLLSPSFGIPDAEDPDPFGVLALGMAGMEIREAGTRSRPDSSQFEYCPSPTSSVFPRVGRRSVDTYLSRSNRGSYTSNKTMATEQSHMTDAYTNTGHSNTAQTTPSPGRSEDGSHPLSDDIPEIKEPEEVDYTQIDISALRKLSAFPDLDDEPTTIQISHNETHDVDDVELTNTEPIDALHIDVDEPANTSMPPAHEEEADADDEDDAGEEDDDEGFSDDDDLDFEDAEEPIIYEVATAQPPRMAIVASHAVQVKGAVVNIPRRIPPPLPLRSPARMSRRSKSEFGDVSMISSPLRQEFDVASQVDEATTPKPGETIFLTPLGSTSVIEATGVQSASDAQASTEEEVEIERPATPTQETVEYFSRSHIQSPTAAAQASINDEEKIELMSPQGVPVVVS
jgi:hypothetical protein